MSSCDPASPALLEPGPNLIKTPTRQFNISRGQGGDYVNVEISEPKLRADGLGLETWASSYILAGLLHRFKPGAKNHCDGGNTLPILELGAGTGLVGIAAQLIWNRPVILTDLEPIVPGLQLNIDLNTHLNAQLEQRDVPVGARAGTLDWRNPTKVFIHSKKNQTYSSQEYKAQVILAADTIYSEEHPEMIASVISCWLAPNSESRLIIAYPMRVAYLDEIRDLWHRLEGVGLETVEEGKETASEEMFDDELLIEWSIWRWRLS